MNAPLRFTCPGEDCDGAEWTAHGMSYIGQVVKVRKLKCATCGEVVEQTEPMLAIVDADDVSVEQDVATDGGEQSG